MLSIGAVFPLLLALLAGLGLAAVIIKLPLDITFWTVLARIADVGDLGLSTPVQEFAAGFVGILVPLFATLISSFHPRPQLAYPISRKRQAQVVFFLGIGQLGSAFGIQVGALLVLSVLGQVLSGVYLSGLGVFPAAALGVPILTAGPFMLAAMAQNNGLARIIGAVAAGLGLVAIAATRASWLPDLFSPVGIATLLSISAVGTAFYWWSVSEHYRQDDILPSGMSGEVPLLQEGN